MFDRLVAVVRRVVDRRAGSATSSLDRPHVDFAAPSMRQFIADTIRDQAVSGWGVEPSKVYARTPAAASTRAPIVALHDMPFMARA